MTRERRKILQGLVEKGLEKQPGSDHDVVRYYDTCGRRSAVRTKFSRGSKKKSLGDGLLATIGKQCHLSIGQLSALVDCTMSREDYEDHLRSEGVLE